jgi:hypothetical protein
MDYSFNRHVGFRNGISEEEWIKYLERRAYEVLNWTGMEVRTNPFGQERYFMGPVIVTRAEGGRLKSFFCSFSRREEVPVVKSEQFLIRLIKLAIKNKQRENDEKRLTAGESLVK